MNKLVIYIMLLLSSTVVLPQNNYVDKIIFSNGDTINCTIKNLTKNHIEIVHKKHSHVMLKVVSKVKTNNISFANKLSKMNDKIISTENGNFRVLDLTQADFPNYTTKPKEKIYNMTFSLFSSTSFYSRMGMNVGFNFHKFKFLQINFGYSVGIKEEYELFYNDNYHVGIGLNIDFKKIISTLKINYMRVSVNNNYQLKFNEDLFFAELEQRIYPFVNKKYYLLLGYRHIFTDTNVAQKDNINGVQFGIGFHL